MSPPAIGAIDAGDARVELRRVGVGPASSIEIVVQRAGREQRLHLRRSTAVALVALLAGALDRAQRVSA
ncbi:MAG TPA: hypothetical protein VGM56_32705 [Byssovorax sp.]